LAFRIYGVIAKFYGGILTPKNGLKNHCSRHVSRPRPSLETPSLNALC